MALETATYINGLVSSNPAGTDQVAQGDDHLRLIKSTLLATFPSITGPVTATQVQLNTAASGNYGSTGVIANSFQTYTSGGTLYYSATQPGNTTNAGFLGTYSPTNVRQSYANYFDSAGPNYMIAMTDGATPVTIGTNGNIRFTISAVGVATFSSNVNAAGYLADGGANSNAIISSQGAVELYANTGPYIDFKTNSTHDYDARIQQNGTGDLTFSQALGGNTYFFTSPSNSLVYSRGLGGYGAFTANGSGTNNGYVFFTNTTNGELGRISGSSGGILDFSTGTSATLKMRLANGIQVCGTGGAAPTGGDMGVGTLNVAGGLYVNGTAISGSGTVSSVATSGGITGGTITSTGTISLDTNNSMGIGAVAMLKNGGSSTANGATLAATSLVMTKFDSSGVLTSGGAPPGTTWRNISGMTLAFNETGMWIRTA